MEEIMSIIFHGFKLVKDLEPNLPENPPESLSESLDSIAKTFGEANKRLKKLMRISDVGPNRPEPETTVFTGSDKVLRHIESGLMREYWLRHGVSQSMDAVIHTQAQLMAAATATTESGGGNNPAVEVDVSGHLRRFEHTDSGGGTGSSTSRPRRRSTEEVEQETVLVAAPMMGNTEVPPDDNYTWRKYGQKEILGSRFPRAYYRCTHQKLYNCPAKKQVQRLDDDPFTFRVKYRGSHTCNISTTAPVSSATAATSSSGVAYVAEVADMANAMFNFSGGGMDFIFSDHDSDRHRSLHGDSAEKKDMLQ